MLATLKETQMKVPPLLILSLLLGWPFLMKAETEPTQGKEKVPAPVHQPESESKPRAPPFPSPGRFTPSEKISADSALSFPVDI